jgi:tetratricopeptide (TPR) repeat protein
MLFGRGREIDGIDGMLDACTAGRCAVRVISGEPGIGKTRLADEAAERAARRGFVVAWGRAWETGGAPPYWPWIEALRPVAEAVQVDAPKAVRALLDGGERSASGEGTRADPARERFELFEGVSTFLRACAKTTPLLLVFDDLHTADLPTLELLAFVARALRPTRSPIGIVATWRDAEARLPAVAEVITRISREAEVLALRPLSSEDVAEVVRHELGRFDAPLASALFDVTEGNPLFLRETLHAVCMRSAAASSLDALRDVAVAGGVTAVVRTRLVGASDEHRALLETASALGREVPLGLFAEAASLSLDDARRALEEATARGLLVRRSEDRWVFAHVLVREAFYKELSPERRRALHAAIAGALAKRIETGREAELATLAHHRLASLPTGRAEDATTAVHTARRAAERARALLAYEEAIALLDRALAACAAFDVDEAERAEVVLALGWACTEAGRLERGRELFREGAALARRHGDARLLARAALGQGGQYVLAEIRAELVDVLREALDALGEGGDADDVRLRARVLARLAAALTPSATPEEPLALARRALAMVANETDTRTRIDVDVGAGSAFVDFAPAGERIAVNERLLRDAREIGDRVLELRALSRLACDHLERGDVASADATIEARARLAEALGHPRYEWQTPLIRSMRAMPDGRFEDCERWIEEARRLGAESGDPNAERCIAVHRFCMLLVAGRTDDLVAQQPEMIRTVDLLPDGAFLHRWCVAMTALRTGDREQAAAFVRSLGESHFLKARMLYVYVADCAVRSGAREVYEQLYAFFGSERDSTASIGPFAFACTPPVATTLGKLAFGLGRADEGVAHYEAALALARRMRASAHEAWVELGWGEDLAAAGVAGAREHLDAAIAIAERLGMPEVIARARAAMDASPTSKRASAPPPSSVAKEGAFTIAKDGADWVVSRGGRSFRVKDVRGMSMIARLVENAGRELHAIDVAADLGSADTPAVIDLGDSGEVLDARAREAYKKRIAELREELEEAEGFHDEGRTAKLRHELEALTQQIAGAVGLGGRERRTGTAAERARITVQRRVREAIKKIAEQDAELGRHLDWTIRTGTYCAYEPEGRKTGRS